MTDSKYPTSLDSDVEIPRVDDNITEIGGEAINSLRSAVFNIEETLGLDPQGTASDVATRLNRALNPDGSIRASALEAIALVTLPIMNKMVANNAGIEEIKLDLDYGTAWLKAQHDSNYALIISTMSALAIDIGHLASHIAHPATYGRHRTSDIDGYAGAVYDGYDLQGIVSDLNTRIINHLANPKAAHAASAISFDDTNLPIYADNVQDAIKEATLYIEGATIRHQDNQHSNGVLRAQDVFYDDTNHSYVIVSPTNIFGAGAGTTNIQFNTGSLPTFGQVTRGDRIDIATSSKIYTRYVNFTDTTNLIVSFLNPLPVSISSAKATIYKKSEEYAAPAALNIALRKRDISTYWGGSIIQLIHPNAPFILSKGADPRNLTPSAKNISLGWAYSLTPTADIDAYNIMKTFSTSQSAWTVENLAMKLNEYLSLHHFPFVAFTYKNELGIAFDEPDGYMVIAAPSAYSAWSALGFSEGDVAYALNRRFYIDGYQFTNIREIINTIGSVDVSNLNQITNLHQDIVASGLKPSGLVRVSNTPSDNGTYVFDQTSGTNTITINEHTFSVGSKVIVKAYADSFCVPTVPQNRTLYELFIDGYDHNSAAFYGEKRLEYYKEQVVSIQNAAQFFDIVDVSRDFPESARRIAYTISGGTYQMQLGTRGSGASVGDGGVIVVIPSPSALIPGYRFKVYDNDGINYVELEVVQDYTTLITGNSIDIDIYTRPSEERYLQVGKVLHDTSYFKFMEDRRLSGTVGRFDVRDDFIRDYTSYPRSMLNKGGVIRDCGLSYTTTTVTFKGGEVLANGNIYNIPRTTFTVPIVGSISTVYNLYVDGNGVLKFNKNDDFITGKISAPTTREIMDSVDKTILYTVTTDAGGLVSSIADLRRFVNGVDGKIDLLVENVKTGELLKQGTFASLKNVIDYMNNANYPNASNLSRIIRIKGQITHNITTDGTITLPDSTILEGDYSGKGSTVYAAKLIATGGSASDFIRPGLYCTIRNLNFELYPGASIANFIGNSIDAVNGLTVENCNFIIFDNANSYTNIFGSGLVLNNGLYDVVIRNCQFDFYDSNSDNTILNTAVGFMFQVMLENCRVNFSATSATNWIAIGALLTSVYFNECNFVFPTLTTGASTGIQGLLGLNGISVTNCVFTSPSNGSTTVAITTPILWNSFINNNFFNGFYRSIWAGSYSCMKNFISQNIMVGMGYRGIDLESVNSCYITGNAINLSVHPANSALIRLKAPVLSVIDGNILTSDAAGTPPDGYMIHILGTSSKNIISNNILDNGPYLAGAYLWDQGLLKGVYFEGLYSATHMFESIVDNSVFNFTGLGFSTSFQNEGMHFEKLQSSTIANNRVINCRHPLYTFDGYYLTIANNTLNNGYFGDLTSASDPCLYMDGNNSAQENMSTIVGNTIGQYYFTVALLQPTTASVVKITANSGFGINMCSNTITLSALYPGSILGYPLLDLAAPNSVVVGNTFYSTWLIGSLTIPLISVTGNYSLVTNNNLMASAFTIGGFPIFLPARNSVTGTNSTDYMNKGGTYAVLIPQSEAEPYRDGAGYSSWAFSNNGFKTSDTIYNTSNDEMFWFFGDSYIPDGAKLIKVELSYSLTGGHTNAITITLRKDTSWPSWDYTTNLGEGNPPTAVGADVMTIYPSPTTYMTPNTMFNLAIVPVNPPTGWAFYCYKLRITYIL